MIRAALPLRLPPAHDRIAAMQQCLAFRVLLDFNTELGTWFVAQSDIPGLFIECKTFDEAIEVIVDLAPDLVAGNIPEWEGDLNDIPLMIQRAVTARKLQAA